MFPDFLNDGLEVGQGTDSGQRRHVTGPRHTTEACQQESGVNHFQGNAAVKPAASRAGLERWRARSLLEVVKQADSLYGLISGIPGYVSATKTLLQELGILNQEEELKAAVDRIIGRFDTAIAALDLTQRMREVGVLVNDARSQLTQLRENAPDDPSELGDLNWQRVSPNVLSTPETDVQKLASWDHWIRPYIPELAYADTPLIWTAKWPMDPPHGSCPKSVIDDKRFRTKDLWFDGCVAVL